MIRGKKVLFRPIEKSDISLFLRWFNDPEVIRYLLSYLPITETMEEKFIEEAISGRDKTHVNFVIEAIENDKTKPIGATALTKIDHRSQTAELAIALGEIEYWGKEYGAEAARLIIEYGFNQLNLNRIESRVFGPNQRSLKLHQKLGFIREGVQRQAFYKNGEYMDIVCFGLLRKEWKG